MISLVVNIDLHSQSQCILPAYLLILHKTLKSLGQQDRGLDFLQNCLVGGGGALQMEMDGEIFTNFQLGGSLLIVAKE